MKNKLTALLLTAAMLTGLAACSAPPETNEVFIALSDEEIRVSLYAGDKRNKEDLVRLGDGIIYYKDGTDETYGEGTDEEKHSAEEADAHQVVTITQPGTYRLSGKLSKGQILVDLGEDAKRDPEAVVTLILDGVDVTCTVAPALLFYRVYECDEAWVAYDEGETEEYEGSPNADTSKAGANVIIAAGSQNNFTGSHVARIYKEGTTKKLHKYDGAFYSRMSMNIDGETDEQAGVLNIVGDNEGLNSEMHLSLNGGNIHIFSQDDGINTNEDNVSVTTLNGSMLYISAGLGAEGDGIDSNGYLTVNGGSATIYCNENSPDGGIDADCAITVNGGGLVAFGNMNGQVDNSSEAAYMQLSFAEPLQKDDIVTLENEDGTPVFHATAAKNCQMLTLATEALELDIVYHVYVNGVQQGYTGTGGGFGMGGDMGQRPDGMEPSEGFEPGQHPDGMEPPEGLEPGQYPDGMEPPKDMERPEPPGGFDPGQMGGKPGSMSRPGKDNRDGEIKTDFVLTKSSKSFSGIQSVE